MKDDTQFIRIWEGKYIMIDAIQINKNCSASDFLEKLSDKEHNRVYALFALLDQKKGTITNKQKLRKLHFACDDCFEFKSTSQLRISFIYFKQLLSHKRIYLLDGFRKKQDKWPKHEIKKTVQLCKRARSYENNIGGTYA